MKISAIKAEDLSFSYPASQILALNNINLNIIEGSWVSIMGATGAGKTTLSLCLNGLIPHAQPGEMRGHVFIYGEDTLTSSIPYHSSRVGVIFQDFDSQLFSSKVELEIAFGMENFSIERDLMKKRIEELLEKFSLQKYAKTHPSELSGGERQRLAIASVFALFPKILVLDEPSTDLDPLNKKKLLSLIKELHKDGITIIWIDHETEPAFESNKLIIMENGKIAQEVKFREFFYRDDVLSRFSIKPLEITYLFKKITPVKNIPINYEESLEEIRNMTGRSKWKLSKERQKKYISKKSSLKSDKKLIIAEALCHTYSNGIKALDGINLEIKEGEFVAIIGQNGSGKTTLVKHVNGLLMPTSGRMIVKDKDTRTLSIYELSKTIGFCFQNPDNQIFASTVLEEISFGPKNFNLLPSQIDKYVKEALESVGLSGTEENDPFTLTKGERQRIAIASILSIKPEIMIFDEPTTGLDYNQILSMMELIDRLNKQGHTIIIITHCMWVAARYAERCIVMADGKILLDGDTHEVFSDEATLQRASLLPPDIVSLGNALGVTTLTVEEFMYCLEQ